MFKNALVSVSDKTGLVEFLKPLADKGLRVVSTGGTAAHLKENGIKVIDLKDQTGFPEVMGGRVKTLHPRVHMPLLARANEPGDLELLKKEGLDPFDLLIVNLYPFEATLKQEGMAEHEMIEKIDIGGPSLLRGAAKNFDSMTVVCDPADFKWLAKGETTRDERKKLAGKVFAHVSRYDSLISHWFGAFWGEEISLGGTKVGELRYGENPEQKASWYGFSGSGATGLHAAKIIQGKPLSYNNILDLEAATLLASKFEQQTAAVGVKHNNPCGVAIDESLSHAVEKMIAADPVSIFGGIIALNSHCDAASAEKLNKIFLECVIAPSFDAKALEIFATKKNLRVLEWPELNRAHRPIEMKTVAGGFLIQTVDSLGSPIEHWKYVNGKPSHTELADLVFAEKVCASLKSNSIAIVRNLQTLGLGMGQVNRVEAVQHAIDRMRSHHAEATAKPSASGSSLVLASDAFFPFPDSIVKAADAGVKWILQPGGSVKDEEVINEAVKRNINMVITGTRHFRH